MTVSLFPIGFKQIYDALTKQKELAKAFDVSIEMLRRSKYMFNEVCNYLLEDKEFRGKKIDIIKILSKEDQKLNEMEIKVRKMVFEYLALNTAPDIATALVLTSIVIDLERLGDYTKDLAKLTLLKIPKLTKDLYIKEMEGHKNDILKIFELTEKALLEDDSSKARKVMELNKKLRMATDKTLLKLEADTKIKANEAIIYTLFTRYFRRVSGHLENIASSVVKPFPYLGFKGY